MRDITIDNQSTLGERLQESTWVSPRKAVAEASCGKRYAETLPSSPSLGFFPPTAFHPGSEQTPVSGEAV